MRSYTKWTVAAAAVLAATGCGSSRSAGGSTDGRTIFRSVGCADCHTLSAAGAHGTVGPNFDSSEKLTRAQIIRQLNAGVGGMPSFRDKLSDPQERAVADFLYRSMQSR